MLNKIKRLLDPFDSLEHLECDGICRVCAYALASEGIDHQVYLGSIRDPQQGRQFHPHYWLQLSTGSRVIVADYRARRWLPGDHIPHGVFYRDEATIVYDGRPAVGWYVDYAIYLALTMPIPESVLLKLKEPNERR